MSEPAAQAPASRSLEPSTNVAASLAGHVLLRVDCPGHDRLWRCWRRVAGEPCHTRVSKTIMAYPTHCCGFIPITARMSWMQHCRTGIRPWPCAVNLPCRGQSVVVRACQILSHAPPLGRLWAPLSAASRSSVWPRRRSYGGSQVRALCAMRGSSCSGYSAPAAVHAASAAVLAALVRRPFVRGCACARPPAIHTAQATMRTPLA